MSEITLFPARHRRLNQPIVLLPGWGFDCACWLPLLPLLREWSDVYCVQQEFTDADSDGYCARLAATLPDKAVVAGWSLGGQLATRLAAQYPHSVSALITLSTNVTFIARENWPTALSPANYKKFSGRFSLDVNQALQRFCKLVCHADAQASGQYQWLQAQLSGQGSKQRQDELLKGLKLLESIDNSNLLSRLQCPGLHLFGQRDVLVPVATVSVVDKLLPKNHRVQIMSDRGHLLHYPATLIESLLLPFLSELAIDD